MLAMIKVNLLRRWGRTALTGLGVGGRRDDDRRTAGGDRRALAQRRGSGQAWARRLRRLPIRPCRSDRLVAAGLGRAADRGAARRRGCLADPDRRARDPGRLLDPGVRRRTAQLPDERLVLVSGQRPRGAEVFVGAGAATRLHTSAGRAAGRRGARVSGRRHLPLGHLARGRRRRAAARDHAAALTPARRGQHGRDLDRARLSRGADRNRGRAGDPRDAGARRPERSGTGGHQQPRRSARPRSSSPCWRCCSAPWS